MRGNSHAKSHRDLFRVSLDMKLFIEKPWENVIQKQLLRGRKGRKEKESNSDVRCDAKNVRRDWRSACDRVLNVTGNMMSLFSAMRISISRDELTERVSRWIRARWWHNARCTRVNLTICTSRHAEKKKKEKRARRTKKKTKWERRTREAAMARNRWKCTLRGENAFIGADNVGSLLSRAHESAPLSFFVFDARVKRD